MNSIKKNVVYSSILTISGYLFPLLTFPYITRVLGVNSIGICNFVDSIIQYFIYFSMMGITTVGIREIARSKGDQLQLSKTYSSLLSLNLLTTLIALLILTVCVFCIPQIKEYRFLFWIGAAKILANTMLIEWLFKGLEDFKYITIRTIIIRGVYVVLVFLLVHKPEDYTIYFALTSFMVVGNAIINLLYSKKFVKVSFTDIKWGCYCSPFITLGIYNLLTSMYTTFNVAFLGFNSNATEVGYYSTATKLYGIIMSFFTAFTGVMMPRMSVLLEENNISEFKRMTNKSVEALYAFAIPLIIFTECCASHIVYVIAGEGYEGAVTPMRIVMPLMLIIGYEQVLVLQMLSPMRKDAAILKNSLFGALVALCFNIALVPSYASKGTAIVWVFSEISVMLSAQYYVNKYVKYRMPIRALIKRLIFAFPLLLLSLVVTHFIQSCIGVLCIVAVISFLGCAIVEIFVLKNELILSNIDILKEKFKRR